MSWALPVFIGGDIDDGANTDDTPAPSPPAPPGLPIAPEPLALADLHILAAQGRQDAIEALLREFRPVIVRYVRTRLARAQGG